ncbi:SWF/SNF helicase family protein, partial [bacterium LRH843]|nr:SWF/SNF helicase family protein [bacterium LRH843]
SSLEFGPDTSAKLDLLETTIAECLSLGRKIIVYSQFVEMQKLIIERLKRMQIEDVLWLHGGTKNRGKIVEDFQRDDGPRVI